MTQIILFNKPIPLFSFYCNLTDKSSLHSVLLNGMIKVQSEHENQELKFLKSLLPQ